MPHLTRDGSSCTTRRPARAIRRSSSSTAGAATARTSRRRSRTSRRATAASPSTCAATAQSDAPEHGVHDRGLRRRRRVAVRPARRRASRDRRAQHGRRDRALARGAAPGAAARDRHARRRDLPARCARRDDGRVLARRSARTGTASRSAPSSTACSWRLTTRRARSAWSRPRCAMPQHVAAAEWDAMWSNDFAGAAAACKVPALYVGLARAGRRHREAARGDAERHHRPRRSAPATSTSSKCPIRSTR